MTYEKDVARADISCKSGDSKSTEGILSHRQDEIIVGRGEVVDVKIGGIETENGTDVDRTKEKL